MDETKLININTGEVISIDAPDTTISEALKAVKLKINEYEEIEKHLLLLAKDRVREGDTDFAGYWTVQFQSPRINEQDDVKLLGKIDRDTFKSMKKAFDKFKKQVFAPILAKKEQTIVIKFPKY